MADEYTPTDEDGDWVPTEDDVRQFSAMWLTKSDMDRFLARVRRDAWQEGYDRAQAVHCDAIQPCDVTTPNPYEESL